MKRIIIVAMFVVFVFIPGLSANADQIVYDSGEIALNGTNPFEGDLVATGGWVYDPTGSNYGKYTQEAAYEGELGIQLKGHGTYIHAPLPDVKLGIASATTRIVDATGGVPNDLARSELRLHSDEYWIRISPLGGDFYFYWSVYNESGLQSGIIDTAASANNENWWTYKIELVDAGDAIFSVYEGGTWFSETISHGITADFTKFTVGVDRWSSGSQIAIADFDNLSFTAVPEPTTMLLLGTGLIGLAGVRRKTRK